MPKAGPARKGNVKGAKTSRLQRLGGHEHLLGVAGDLHLAPHLGDPPVRTDQEGRAFDAHIFASIHALLDPDAIGRKHRLRLVRGQSNLQLVFRAELVVALLGIGGDAEDRRSGLGEFVAKPVELDRLLRAAGSVVLGVEIERELLALVRGEPVFFAAGPGKGEIRGRVSGFRSLRVGHLILRLVLEPPWAPPRCGTPRRQARSLPRSEGGPRRRNGRRRGAASARTRCATQRFRAAACRNAGRARRAYAGARPWTRASRRSTTSGSKTACV